MKSMMHKLFVCENCNQVFQRQPDEMVLHYRGLPLCSERCAAQLSAAMAEKKDSNITCKDCIHQTVCSNKYEEFGREAESCEHFSNKSEWFHLSAKDHETAYDEFCDIRKRRWPRGVGVWYDQQAAMEAYADYLLNPDEIDNELENYKE